MKLSDCVDFLNKVRDDNLLKPIICGEPATTLWLKLKFENMRPGQVIDATVVETLYHPERGYAIYTKGQKIAFTYKDLRVAKVY